MTAASCRERKEWSRAEQTNIRDEEERGEGLDDIRSWLSLVPSALVPTVLP